MNWHIKYWLARFRNEFRQITFREPTEASAVTEVMAGLKRDPKMRKIIEEKEVEMFGSVQSWDDDKP